MQDQFPNWRNQRWYFDADYVERDTMPVLAQLIEQNGFMFDDTYKYIFHGKAKQYIVRFPHYGGVRDDPRTDIENVHRKERKKQATFKIKAAELILVTPKRIACKRLEASN